MSSSSADYGEERQDEQTQPAAFSPKYVLTADEKRVLKECNFESFWYRSLPFSLFGMATTQALVSKGILSGHGRFKAGPKLIFAGMIGYMAGKFSYQKTCMERLSRLENSPLGEFLRQTKQATHSAGSQSTQSESNVQSLDSNFQTSQAPTVSSGYEYNPDVTPEMSRTNDLDAQAPVQSYVDEEIPSKKTLSYGDRRLKNRENYEVTLTQRSEAPVKPAPDSVPKRPTDNVKKNIYGDTWEE